MAIKIYSRLRDGEKPLSANFKVKEFACKDGSDTVLVCERLVLVLQHIRDRLGKPVRVNSGYRTPEHNKKVGGATTSQHMKGTAADIAVTGVTPFEVACAAEEALAKCGVTVGGIGKYDTFTHVDTRNSGKWRQDMTTGKNVTAFTAVCKVCGR